MRLSVDQRLSACNFQMQRSLEFQVTDLEYHYRELVHACREGVDYKTVWLLSSHA